MIGKKIYEFRKQKGLTLSELANRARISKSYLSNIERNLNPNPSIQVVRKIATVLDVDLDTFLGPIKTNNVKEKADQDLLEFAKELKETGIEIEQIKEYKTLIEYIKWKKIKAQEEKN